MRAEIVAVGTELLLGQIVDTNSSWLGEQLAAIGVDSYFQTKVGDNQARIVAVLRQALDRSDVVLVTGGLGPTQDDITRESIAELLGVELEYDPAIAAAITARFAVRNRPMPANNLRQAYVPAGCTAITDPYPGTAPGLVCPVGDKVIYAVPGVPSEMRAIASRFVLPDLTRRGGTVGIIASRTLRTWGESESGVAERLADRVIELDRTGVATIAFLASGIEGIKVRLTCRAPSMAEATAVLDVEEAAVRAILGDIVFGIDDDNMEMAVIALLQERGLTLATAESVTGGLIGARLTAVPGASAAFRGGVISYASEVKYDVLGLPEGPVVTASAAEQMALGAQRVLGADVGLGITGVAGPTEQEGVPVGTVFVGLAVGVEVTVSHLILPGDRRSVRDFSTISALDLLRRRLLASD
jgi:nicotinamide-nucleotide amidase